MRAGSWPRVGTIRDNSSVSRRRREAGCGLRWLSRPARGPLQARARTLRGTPGCNCVHRSRGGTSARAVGPRSLTSALPNRPYVRRWRGVRTLHRQGSRAAWLAWVLLHPDGRSRATRIPRRRRDQGPRRTRACRRHALAHAPDVHGTPASFRARRRMATQPRSAWGNSGGETRRGLGAGRVSFGSCDGVRGTCWTPHAHDLRAE